MRLKNLEYRSLWYKKIYYYLKAGQSLSEASKTASTDSDTWYIYERLLEGSSLFDVCNEKKFVNIFTNAEKSLILISEKTGKIEKTCLSLSDLLKSQNSQKQKIIASAIYPCFVLFMSLSLLIMILVIIVPKISPLFYGMNTLPVTTKMLMILSNHVISFWYVDVIVIILIFLSHIGLNKNKSYIIFLKLLQKKIYKKIPYIRDVYVLWNIEKWLSIMNISLLSNITLVESLLYASESVYDTEIKNYFLDMRNEVIKGNSCYVSMKSMPALVYNKMKDWISIISSGEKTGSLHDVFNVAYTNINENLLKDIDRFQKIIEPVLIVCVGLMVLLICLSIILPMYQLTQSI